MTHANEASGDAERGSEGNFVRALEDNDRRAGRYDFDRHWPVVPGGEDFLMCYWTRGQDLVHLKKYSDAAYEEASIESEGMICCGVAVVR